MCERRSLVYGRLGLEIRHFNGHLGSQAVCCVHSESSLSTILVAACPSHFSGIEPSREAQSRTEKAASRILAGSLPTRMFVPISQVIGRSVLDRSVIQGMPSAVVSS